MADFTDIVTEFKTIATAQSGINSFKYAHAFELNESRSSSKPMLLLHKQTAYAFPTFDRKIKQFNVTVGIYDNYFQSEKATKTYANKQKDLENLIEQFIREFRKRTTGQTAQITSAQNWFMSQQVNLELIEAVGTDKLIGVEATFEISVFADCDEGTFSY